MQIRWFTLCFLFLYTGCWGFLIFFCIARLLHPRNLKAFIKWLNISVVSLHVSLITTLMKIIQQQGKMLEKCEQTVSRCSSFTSFIALCNNLKDRLWDAKHRLIWSDNCDSMLASVWSLLNRKIQNAPHLRKFLQVGENRCTFGIM